MFLKESEFIILTDEGELTVQASSVDDAVLLANDYIEKGYFNSWSEIQDKSTGRTIKEEEVEDNGLQNEEQIENFEDNEFEDNMLNQEDKFNTRFNDIEGDKGSEDFDMGEYAEQGLGDDTFEENEFGENEFGGETEKSEDDFLKENIRKMKKLFKK